jgi:hypothetical protein
VKGAVAFSSANVFRGKVTVTNNAPERRPIAPGTYADCSVPL